MMSPDDDVAGLLVDGEYEARLFRGAIALSPRYSLI
jgi:hypothetical protein